MFCCWWAALCGDPLCSGHRMWQTSLVLHPCPSAGCAEDIQLGASNPEHSSISLFFKGQLPENSISSPKVWQSKANIAFSRGRFEVPPEENAKWLDFKNLSASGKGLWQNDLERDWSLGRDLLGLPRVKWPPQLKKGKTSHIQPQLQAKFSKAVFPLF